MRIPYRAPLALVPFSETDTSILTTCGLKQFKKVELR